MQPFVTTFITSSSNLIGRIICGTTDFHLLVDINRVCFIFCSGVGGLGVPRIIRGEALLQLFTRDIRRISRCRGRDVPWFLV